MMSNLKDMPHVTVEQVIRFREEALKVQSDLTAAKADTGCWKIVAEGQAKTIDALNSGVYEKNVEIEALKSIVSKLVEYLPYSPTECHGDKCREEWCRSCMPEETVQDAMQEVSELFECANKLLVGGVAE